MKSPCARNVIPLRGPFGVFILFLTLLASRAQAAEETWAKVLSRMPLPANVTHFTSTNCVEVFLNALSSNTVVKGVIFMPGATDEFYMFHRAKADLTNENPTLLDAIVALTNQSRIQASFRPPLLLLHAPGEKLTPDIKIESPALLPVLQNERHVPRLLFNDRDWDTVQPALRWALKIDIRPWQRSSDSWHFYRHSFCGWNLSGLEALQATALAGKTRLTVRRKQAVFEPETPKISEKTGQQ